jgi:hypothetical protein
VTVCLHATALAVAIIYYGWRDGYLVWLRRERMIRERVAYMLWSASHHVA